MAYKWADLPLDDKILAIRAIQYAMEDHNPKHHHVFEAAIEALGGGRLDPVKWAEKWVELPYFGAYPDDALVFEMDFPPIAYITMEFRGFRDNGDLVFVSLDGELDDPNPGVDWVIPLKEMVRFASTRRPLTPAAKQLMADLTGSK